MTTRSSLAKTAAVLMFLAASPQSSAQETPAGDIGATPANAAPHGIRTDRLKPCHLRIWKAIERMALEVNRDGRPVRPTLNGLWQWAQKSRHAIYVEMDGHEAFHHSAGVFKIEDFNQEPQSWTAAIWLNLSIIQAADKIKKRINGSNRSISLAGVGRDERCAIIFGHELVHAFLIIEDPQYARLYQECELETAEYYLAGGLAAKAYGENLEMQKRLRRLQSIMDQLEAPADSVEINLWREIVPGLANGARK
jgi:hypothetical protein